MKIYCIAIGGTGMAPLACLLQELGHEVSGSDLRLYPPMSDLLRDAGIEPYVGWDGTRVQDLLSRGDIDLVIVGNAVPRSHPEAVAMESAGAEYVSMPQAIARFLLPGRRPLVVAGTHGKTTTTAMAAWVYSQLGEEPSYLIGGWPIGLDASFRLGAGPRFLIEGDEYNAAYFDRGAKFLHYQPETAIVTSVEWDHADLYRSAAAFRSAFEQLIDLLEAQSGAAGHLVLCADDEDLVQMVRARQGLAEVTSYGFGQRADVRIDDLRSSDAGMTFRLTGESPFLRAARENGTATELNLRVWGEHNAANATAVWCAARRDGFAHRQIAEALASFRGVRRRLEEIGTRGGVTVVDDFAHHPTEVEKSLGGLLRRYDGRRILLAFEPRSLSAGRALLHEQYLEALRALEEPRGGGRVWFAPIFHHDRLPADERLDLDLLCRQLCGRGVEAIHTNVDEMLAQILAAARSGDVVATMSSGSFDGLPRRVLEGLPP